MLNKLTNHHHNHHHHHHHHYHHHHPQSLNCEGCWRTTDDFATSLIHLPLFSNAFWDLPNWKPVHSLMLSSHLFLLSALSSSTFHYALQNGFGDTWCTRNMTFPLQFASVYDYQEIFAWSNCLLALGTDFLIGCTSIEIEYAALNLDKQLSLENLMLSSDHAALK